MSKRWKFSVMMCFLTLMLLTAGAYACPMCKDSIPSSDAAQAGSLPGGFNNSVYLFLVGFITVTCAVSGLIFKAVRDTGIKPGFPVIPNPPKK